MKLVHKALVSVVFSLCSIQPVKAAVITYSTGDFISSEWSSHIWNESTGTSTASTSTVGGNPDAYRRVSMTVDPFETVLNNQLWSVAEFTPATQGMITSVALSYDISRVFTSHAAATQVAKGISVQQDGVIHTSLLGVSTTSLPIWESVSVENLLPLFPSVDWTSGSKISFGFFNAVSTQEQGFTIDGGYDNYNVTVNFNPNATQVPETVNLLGTGMVFAIGLLLNKRALKDRSKQSHHWPQAGSIH